MTQPLFDRPSTKHIRLRLVDSTDAAFIVDLRRGSEAARYLSPISGDIKDQHDWIAAYKLREAAAMEYYFLLVDQGSGLALGTVRLYNFNGSSFSWGSWIVRSGAPSYTAIESALSVYEIAFTQLGLTQSRFSVRRANTKVINFHLRFGAQLVAQDEIDMAFQFDSTRYAQTRARYQKFLLHPAPSG